MSGTARPKVARTAPGRGHRHCFQLASAVLALATVSGAAIAAPERSLEATFRNSLKSARPMVRWWWPGNAVDDAELRRQIALLDDAGFGGAEIQPFSLGTNVFSAEQRALADSEEGDRCGRPPSTTLPETRAAMIATDDARDATRRRLAFERRRCVGPPDGKGSWTMRTLPVSKTGAEDPTSRSPDESVRAAESAPSRPDRPRAEKAQPAGFFWGRFMVERR